MCFAYHSCASYRINRSLQGRLQCVVVESRLSIIRECSGAIIVTSALPYR